jgi:hypothetical protein
MVLNSKQNPSYMNSSEDQTMMANGFEEAIIGLDTSGEVFRVVYDIDAIISILMERDEMTEEDALEYFSYNVQGSYVGEGTPIYVYGGGHDRVLELISNS